MKAFNLLLVILLSACSATEENAKAFTEQGYQDAQQLRITNKQECIFHMIGTNANQLEGCFNYVEEFKSKARLLSESESDAFEAAPSADGLENSITSDEETDECLVSEGGAEYITECNNFMK